jgi:hypothetical protein
VFVDLGETVSCAVAYKLASFDHQAFDGAGGHCPQGAPKIEFKFVFSGTLGGGLKWAPNGVPLLGVLLLCNMVVQAKVGAPFGPHLWGPFFLSLVLVAPRQVEIFALWAQWLRADVLRGGNVVYIN